MTNRFDAAYFARVLIACTLINLIANSTLLAQGTASSVDAKRCPVLCNGPSETDKKTGNYIIIDANSGDILHGSDEYPSGPLHIFVTNENPFKYDYKVQVNTTSAESTLIKGFLGLIPGVGDAINQAMGQGVAKGALPMAPSCTGDAQDALAKLRAKSNPALNEGAKLKADLQAKVTEHDELKKLYESLTSSTNLTCANLCEIASGAYPRLKAFDLRDLQQRLEDFKKGVTDPSFQGLIKAFDPSGDPNCAAATKDELDKIKALGSDADKYVTDVNKLQENLKKFHDLADQIETAFKSESPFVYTATVPAATEAKLVTIGISRKEHTDGAQYVKVTNPDIQIQVGTRTTFLSAGFGFSTIGDRIVIRQASLVPDPSDSTKTVLGSRFGYQNNSTFKPSAVIMLNEVLLGPKSGLGFKGVTGGLSLGLVISNRNETTEAEFIAGPSLGFNHNKIFLTFGFHAARQQRLAGGFNIGDQVPADLQDPLPVERDFKAGFMFAMTFKLR
ncbi:MAG: hypothetical protein ABSA70_01855 [Terriglobia bacterium]